MEFRIALSHVDRGVERTEAVIVGRHPSETMEHLVLRVLAWCLFNEEGIAFGPGLSSADTADLWVHDLTGRLTTWIECGTARFEHVRRAVHQHSGAKVHALFASERRANEFRAEISDAPHAKEASAITLWSIDPALVAALAAREERRQKWSVTIVGDHLYVDADGVNLDGAVESSPAVD